MKKFLMTLPFLATMLFALPATTYAGQCTGVQPVSSPEYVEVISAVWLKDKACEGETLATLPAGAVVEVKGKIVDEWYQLEYEGKTGYVFESFVKPVDTPDWAKPKEPLWDVGNHKYKEAIWNLYNLGIVSGNDGDKSFGSNKPINRAEFSKIAILAHFDAIPPSPNGCLNDVPGGEWYTDVVCHANKTLINGEPIIAGHPGGLFKAGDFIQFDAAAKILSLLYALEVGEGGAWYEGYIDALEKVNAIPVEINSPGHLVTKAQMAEMMDRLILQDTSRPSAQFNYQIQFPEVQEEEAVEEPEAPEEPEEPVDLVEPTAPNEPTNLSACLNDATPATVDYSALQAKALELTNQARSDRGLTPFELSDALNASSQIWAQQLEALGQITHDRPGDQPILDYEAGIGVSATAFAENLGEHSLNCSGDDCTQEALTALENIHDLFIAEEDQEFDGHFQNIVGDYTDMGFGFSVVDGKIMLVFQYGIVDEVDEDLLCENLK